MILSVFVIICDTGAICHMNCHNAYSTQFSQTSTRKASLKGDEKKSRIKCRLLTYKIIVYSLTSNGEFTSSAFISNALNCTYTYISQKRYESYSINNLNIKVHKGVELHSIELVNHNHESYKCLSMCFIRIFKRLGVA